jgi:hypothetical protein
MTDSSNDNNNIKDIIPEPEIEDLPTAETQDDQFVRNLYIFPTVKEAAEAAGYTGSMLKSGVYNKIKTKRFQDKMKEFAITHNVMTLPKIMQIEDKVIEHLLKKPLESNKHVRMLAEKKRIAGVLGEDTPPPQGVTFNIKEFYNQHWAPRKALYEKSLIPEAEVISDKKEE